MQGHFQCSHCNALIFTISDIKKVILAGGPDLTRIQVCLYGASLPHFTDCCRNASDSYLLAELTSEC